MTGTMVPASLGDGIDLFPRLLDGQPGDIKNSDGFKVCSPSSTNLTSLNELQELLENMRSDLDQLEASRRQRFAHLRHLCAALSKRKSQRALKVKAATKAIESEDHKPSGNMLFSHVLLSQLDVSDLTLDQFAARLSEAGVRDIPEDGIVELLDAKSMEVEAWPYGSEVEEDSVEAGRAFHPWAANLDLLHKDVKFIADRIRHEEVSKLLGVWRMQMDQQTLQSVKALV